MHFCFPQFAKYLFDGVVFRGILTYLLVLIPTEMLDQFLGQVIGGSSSVKTHPILLHNFQIWSMLIPADKALSELIGFQIQTPHKIRSDPEQLN
jgi:hypothetical protein